VRNEHQILWAYIPLTIKCEGRHTPRVSPPGGQTHTPETNIEYVACSCMFLCRWRAVEAGRERRPE
jgi:hypothetical protein